MDVGEPTAPVKRKFKKKKRIMQVDEDAVLKEPDQPMNLVDTALPVEKEPPVEETTILR